jgi:hypothetical protein
MRIQKLSRNRKLIWQSLFDNRQASQCWLDGYLDYPGLYVGGYVRDVSHPVYMDLFRATRRSMEVVVATWLALVTQPSLGLWSCVVACRVVSCRVVSFRVASLCCVVLCCVVLVSTD